MNLHDVGMLLTGLGIGFIICGLVGIFSEKSAVRPKRDSKGRFTK